MAKVKKVKKNTSKKTAGKNKSRIAKAKSIAKKKKKTAIASRKSNKKKSTIKKQLKRPTPQSTKKKITGSMKKKLVKKAKKSATKKKKVISKKSQKKVTRSTAVKNKVAKPSVVKRKPEIKKTVKNNNSSTRVIAAIPQKKGLLVKGKPAVLPAKSKMDQEEKLHSKAQRIMKELEETMDMEKVKPRIKVPSYIPPKPKPVPVLKLIEPINTKKEKYQLEFEFRSSKAILFSYLSDSSGMAGWFADEVRSSDNNYTFVWEQTEVHAKLVAVKDQQLVRFQWSDENDGTYFQFEIKEDDITSDIALLITDWANPGEKEANGRLWESQVQNLRQLIGSV